MWKGDTSGRGNYSNETTLTPGNVNPQQFGKLAEHPVDGLIIAQPLYLSNVTMSDGNTHNVVIVATEHDSVYAFDANKPADGPLWERHYATGNATTAPDNFGGRTTIGGEIGITGTPVIDPTTSAMYFVTTLQVNGVTQQSLRVIDVRSGKDVGPGSVQVSASVPGTGVGSSNGQIAFDPSIQNQRSGLVLLNGKVLVGWASFGAFGIYHGWLMAYDAATLNLVAVFNPTTQHQDVDVVDGPSDHGGGGSVWQGGAAPAIDGHGNIYVVTADGSFNVDQGGQNYGDTALKLRLDNGTFQIVDWFTPSNQACLNRADMDFGSGGIALLPSDISGGRNLGAAFNKEGRLFLIDLDNMGHFNSAGDTQIPQTFMVGSQECYPGLGPEHAEGSDWQRLYGKPSYFAGNLYLAPSNGTLHQYVFQNGILNPTPFAQSVTVVGARGGHTVVSSSGTSNGIVWMYGKAPNNQAILHAYDASNVGRELWNSSMNASDAMGEGNSFGTPIVADGKVITAYDRALVIYGSLQ